MRSVEVDAKRRECGLFIAWDTVVATSILGTIADESTAASGDNDLTAQKWKVLRPCFSETDLPSSELSNGLPVADLGSSNVRPALRYTRVMYILARA